MKALSIVIIIITLLIPLSTNAKANLCVVKSFTLPQLILGPETQVILEMSEAIEVAIDKHLSQYLNDDKIETCFLNRYPDNDVIENTTDSTIPSSDSCACSYMLNFQVNLTNQYQFKLIVKLDHVNKNTPTLYTQTFYISYPLVGLFYTKMTDLINNIRNEILGVNFVLTSSPEGASVYYNNHYLGKTPLKGLKGNIGEQYKIELSLDGYKPITKNIQIEYSNQEFQATFTQPMEKTETLFPQISIKGTYYLGLNRSILNENFGIIYAFEHFWIRELSTLFQLGLVDLTYKNVATSGGMAQYNFEKNLTVVPLTVTALYNFTLDPVYLLLSGGLGIGIGHIGVTDDKSDGFAFNYHALIRIRSMLFPFMNLGFYLDFSYQGFSRFNISNITEDTTGPIDATSTMVDLSSFTISFGLFYQF